MLQHDYSSVSTQRVVIRLLQNTTKEFFRYYKMKTLLLGLLGVHVGVSGDRGAGATLKNGTQPHLLVSSGEAASKSELIKHLLRQLTFRPHQSALHACALNLPVSQKMAVVGVAQAAGLGTSAREGLLGLTNAGLPVRQTEANSSNPAIAPCQRFVCVRLLP